MTTTPARMGLAPRVTSEEIIDAYQRTGSVWKAGKLLGITGQSVHYRLTSIGYQLASSKWTDEEIAELQSLVGHETLSGMARRLGRSYAGVACKVSELQLDVGHGNRRVKIKIPRGAGYDKVSIRKHIKALDADPSTPITRYARANGLGVEPLIQAVEKHFPDWWTAYCRAHSDLPEKECLGCRKVFTPGNKRQVYCTRKCGGRHRQDTQYFGGQRNSTHGLAEGMCQVCGRKPDRGLSSHHVLGKENDPDNTVLVALCQGCHQLVSQLGWRDWKEANFEALITYVWMRKHGPELAEGKFGPGGLRVCVDVDWELEEEDEVAV